MHAGRLDAIRWRRATPASGRRVTVTAGGLTRDNKPTRHHRLARHWWLAPLWWRRRTTPAPGHMTVKNTLSVANPSGISAQQRGGPLQEQEGEGAGGGAASLNRSHFVVRERT